jgi:hypothetical protein
MRKLSICVLFTTLCGCWSGDEVKPRITSNVTDWRDEVIYQLMTDRFADGDLGNNYNVDLASPGKYHGGDFAGIEAKIPYLKKLGVTTLWISPVVKNVESDAGFASYHGYWTQDFGAVNPHFGDMASLRHMVDAVHAQNMKVVLDIVTNHVGQLFYYDINGNGEPDTQVYTYGDPATGNRTVAVSEYDPDWDPRGIMGRTSNGEYGPAPIRFFWMPEINRIPRHRSRGVERPRPGGEGRLPRRPEGPLHREARGARRALQSVRRVDRQRRFRRLPHRHGQARRARLLAGFLPAHARARQGAGQGQLPHVR